MKIQHTSRRTSVEEVDTDLFRITLPQPFYAPNHIYVVRDERPLMIDSGYVESIVLLSDSLRKIGMSLNRLHAVLYTHPHIDHITGGLMFSTYARRMITMGHHRMAADIPDFPAFADTFHADGERILGVAIRDKAIRRQRVRHAREKWTEFLKRFDAPDRKPGDKHVRIDVPLRDGDTVSTGKYNFRILETPGHCKWHITPYEASKRWVFSGDLIIGNIPAIYEHLDGNLEAYQSTLAALHQFDGYRMFPAHGDEISDPLRRVKLVEKTLGIFEKGIYRRLQERPHNLAELVESSIGGQVEGGNHFITALALMESIVAKLRRQSLVRIHEQEGTYETYTA